MHYKLFTVYFEGLLANLAYRLYIWCLLYIVFLFVFFSITSWRIKLLKYPRWCYSRFGGRCPEDRGKCLITSMPDHYEYREALRYGRFLYGLERDAATVTFARQCPEKNLSFVLLLKINRSNKVSVFRQHRSWRGYWMQLYRVCKVVF